MKTKHLLKWHKRLGITAALVVLMLSITGIALNHTEELKLDESFVQQTWLNDWYGIHPPKVLEAQPLDAGWFYQTDNGVYYDDNLITDESMIGVVKTDFGYLLVTPNKALLLDAEIALIDILPFDSTATHLYAQGHQIQIQLSDQQRYEANPNWTQLKSSPAQNLPEITLTKDFPAELQQKVNQRTYQSGLTYEKVLLDLHSGRLFGSYGHWFIDLFAVFFLLLSMTGFLIYLRKL